MGQMVGDVKNAIGHQNIPVQFFGRTGGVIPEIEEIMNALKAMMKKEV